MSKLELYVALLAVAILLLVVLACTWVHAQTIPPGVTPGSGQHEENLEGYEELKFLVAVRKGLRYDELRQRVAELEARVEALEEKGND